MASLSGSSTRAQDCHVDLVGSVVQRSTALDVVSLARLEYATYSWLGSVVPLVLTRDVAVSNISYCMRALILEMGDTSCAASSFISTSIGAPFKAGTGSEASYGAVDWSAMLSALSASSNQ